MKIMNLRIIIHKRLYYTKYILLFSSIDKFIGWQSQTITNMLFLKSIFNDIYKDKSINYTSTISSVDILLYHYYSCIVVKMIAFIFFHWFMKLFYQKKLMMIIIIMMRQSNNKWVRPVPVCSINNVANSIVKQPTCGEC